MVDQSLQRFSYNFDDIDLLTEAMAEWDVQFLPLDPTGGHHSTNLLISPNVIVQQLLVGQRVHQQGSTSEGFITFGLPLTSPER